MMMDRYQSSQTEAGKLKLRATALLAEGGRERVLEAAVLFHEAARVEERALLLLPHLSVEDRLVSAVEQCFCLVEGLDPIMAASAWGRVLDAAATVPPERASLLLSRLKPRYTKLEDTFRRAMHQSPWLSAHRGTLELQKGSHQRQFAKELTRLLELFPGAPSLWWLSYRLEESRNRKEVAWNSLLRACELDPENGRFEAIRLHLATHRAPGKEVDAHLTGTFERIHRGTAPPELCLMYACTELALARRSSTESEARLQRALEAVIQGRCQPQSESRIHQYLQAVQLILHARLHRRRPTMELLYRAGLGDVVISSPEENRRDPVALLTHEATQAIVQQAA
jgi:hypothetical protein